MTDITLKIVREINVLGEESYYLVFGDKYVPGSACGTVERANELFDNYKNRVSKPIKEIVRSEIIQIEHKE